MPEALTELTPEALSEPATPGGFWQLRGGAGVPPAILAATGRSPGRFLAVLVVLGILAVPAVRADSLRELIDLGLLESRTAGLLTAELRSQRAQLGAVKSDFAPAFHVSRDTTDRQVLQVTDRLATETLFSASVTEDNRGGKFELFSLSQPLFVHNAIEIARARVQWEIAKLRYDQALEDFKFSVITKFFEALRSHERTKTLEESVERWNRSLAFAEVKFDLGATNKIDVLNTRVNQGNAETELLREQQGFARVKDELKDLVGMPITRPVSLEESLAFEKFETGPVEWKRREVRIAELQVRIAQVELENAEQRSKPDITFDTSYRSTQGAPLVINNQLVQTGDDELVAAVRYSFQLGKRRADYDLDRLREQLRAAKLELESRVVQVEREQRDIVRTIELTERAIETARESLDQARESYEFSLDAFQKGLVSSLDLRDSQDKLTRARDDFTSLLIDHEIAKYRYTKVMGGTL